MNAQKKSLFSLARNSAVSRSNGVLDHLAFNSVETTFGFFSAPEMKKVPNHNQVHYSFLDLKKRYGSLQYE